MALIERVIISGGGTGGHIHPALAIADEIRKRYPNCDIKFVGAKGKMEMTKIPSAGYEIDGLWISGIERKIVSLKNFTFPIKLLSSLIKSGHLLRLYNPQVVIGVGGFASGPILYRASKKGIPTLIQEQNSFPGITNRILAKRVNKVCAGFPGLNQWVPSGKISETGNPLRNSVMKLLSNHNKSDAPSHFNLNPNRPIVFVMGGSLGAASMNSAVRKIINDFISKGSAYYSIIWQCGDRFYSENSDWLEKQVAQNSWLGDYVKCLGFIDRMDLAYSAANLIASRAGAMSISELALVAKPTILIPSPHVAEDHQTKNALSLVDRDAAMMLKDSEVVAKLGDSINSILNNSAKTESMCIALRNASRLDACSKIVDEIELLVNSEK